MKKIGKIILFERLNDNELNNLNNGEKNKISENHNEIEIQF